MWLAVMIVGGVLAAGFLCCVMCNLGSLRTAIDVIDASADFLAGTKRIIAVPFFFFLLQIISVAIWVPCMAYVTSMNHVSPSELTPQLKDIEWKPEIKLMGLYMFFGILWVTAFFEYCSTFTIMVSASTYYWNSDMADEGQAEVHTGVQFCFNHFGSIAIGSFIIALVRFIRITVMYAAKQAEKQSGDNAVVKQMVACAQCILACIEKICDYINESAYAYQAVTGDAFCKAAWNAFMLQLKHMVKFSFAQLIAKVFILLGKVGITAGNMVSCYYIMLLVFKDMEDHLDQPNPDPAVTQATGSVLLVGVFSFMVASIFLGILDTAVLSLLTNVAIDSDNNDGHPSSGPPTFHDRLEGFKNAEEHARDRQKAGWGEDGNMMEEGGERQSLYKREEPGKEKFRETWIYHFMY